MSMSKNSNSNIALSILIIGILICLILVFNYKSIDVVYDAATPLDNSGNIEVALQDQHTEIIDLKLNKLINNITLLQNTNIYDRIININSISAPNVLESICLKEGVAFYQAHILDVDSLGGNEYTIELDTPLDFPYTTSANGCLSIVNMAVDGSVTPVIFSLSPQGLDDNVSWDITRVLIVMSGLGIGAQNLAPDDSDFGVTEVLTNGVVLRSINGITKNIFNVKRNGELRLRAYDVTYTEKSKAGLYSVGVRRSFSGQDKNGVTIRLDAATNDALQIIIQDDLTEMFGMQVVAQGHLVDN